MSECPICFEVMENDNNKITTECGHKFHSNCFLKNVVHNGFNCPCCRKELVRTQCCCDMSDSDSDYEDMSESNILEEFINPPLNYSIDKLKDHFSKRDLLKILVNYYNKDPINEECVDLDSKFFYKFTNMCGYFYELEEEEREIELMTMEDKKYSEKFESNKLVNDVSTIVNTRIY